MPVLTGSVVAQVLNALCPDGNIYCLDAEVPDNPIPPLIYVAVKVYVGERLAYYRIAEKLTIQAAIERIGAVLKEEG